MREWMYRSTYSCPQHYLEVSGHLHAVTYWRGGWLDPRTVLEDVEKRKFFTLPGLELRLLCCPVPTDGATPAPNYKLVLLNFFFKSNLQMYYKCKVLYFSNN
jgi:hypothetical protein